MSINIWAKIILGLECLSLLITLVRWGEQKSIKEYGWWDVFGFFLGIALFLLAFGLKININFN